LTDTVITKKSEGDWPNIDNKCLHNKKLSEEQCALVLSVGKYAEQFLHSKIIGIMGHFDLKICVAGRPHQRTLKFLGQCIWNWWPVLCFVRTDFSDLYPWNMGETCRTQIKVYPHIKIPCNSFFVLKNGNWQKLIK
jgi:hypothetical protein